MQIQNLKNTPLSDIVECLVEAFEGYFVQVPLEIEYWEKRYQRARVNFELSYGVFNEDKLVAFIINGIDRLNGHQTAFNTGTGVIPAYRGQQLVDKMYAYAIPFLKKEGITKCALEVIQENARAISVYKRVGFSIQRSLNSYKGTLASNGVTVTIQKVDFSKIIELGYPKHNFYAWDFSNDALRQSGDVYETYLVMDGENKMLGYFVIDSAKNTLAQIESATKDFPTIATAIHQISKEVRIVNVDDRRTDLIENLLTHGLVNSINQYEMDVDI